MIFWRRINQFKHSIEDLEDQDRPGTPITITKPLLRHRTSRPNNNSLTMIPIFLYINFKHKHRYPMAPPKESFKIIFIFENSWATNPLDILETSWPQAIKSSWVSVGESPKQSSTEANLNLNAWLPSTSKSIAPPLTYCVDKGKTINVQTYIEDCLKPVVSAI